MADTNIKNTPNKDTQNKADENQMIDPRLLEILICPQTRGVLVYDRNNNELLSKKAGLAYPIRDSIPIMLPDEARTLSDEEINRL